MCAMRWRPLPGSSDWPVRRSLPLALVLLVTLAACARPPLPIRLAGLHRNRVWTGTRAATMIGEIHGKQVVPTSSMVADYGTNGELRVYLSLYADETQAFRVLERMLKGIGSGNTPFAPPRQEPGGTGRWLTFGPGGHHLLWVSRGRVYWLQGLPDAVQGAAAELPKPSSGSWT